MTSSIPGRELLDHPSAQRGFAAVRALLLVLFIVSAASLLFAYVERADGDLVNTVVWIRGIAVVAAAVVLYAFAALAARGTAWAYRRLRLLAFLIPCGIVLLIVAPGEFPLWMKVEQAVCGVLVLATGIILSRGHIRGHFLGLARARR
ncbi:hypothetical protein QT381_11755 [Galbitalea sp. SE-J8]|uniref:hypothetical protein n=1 Tax=Galbitalea sp. SE-J8 TaxID=3054952 RepID=UPI00259D21D5|nr:hypothetical protein [Galbitalea sp. SE-J8]MDM4763683.1 hypothetical protein [Galbitalea sp. SE-J8]